MNHWARFLAGLGAVTMIYVPLRFLEERPSGAFIILFMMFAYLLGMLLDRQ